MIIVKNLERIYYHLYLRVYRINLYHYVLDHNYETKNRISKKR